MTGELFQDAFQGRLLLVFFLDKGKGVFKLKGGRNLDKEWSIYAKADLFGARLLYLRR